MRSARGARGRRRGRRRSGLAPRGASGGCCRPGCRTRRAAACCSPSGSWRSCAWRTRPRRRLGRHRLRACRGWGSARGSRRSRPAARRRSRRCAGCGMRPEPWFRSRAGTLTRPAPASVAHPHSDIAGLSAEIARDALVASSEAGGVARRSVAAMTGPEYCRLAKGGQPNPLPREQSRVPLHLGAGPDPLRHGALHCAAWRADGRRAAETRIHHRAGLWLRRSGGRGAPRWPR